MNVDEIKETLDEITSILNHLQSFTSCTHVKDAIPLLKIKLNIVKEYAHESNSRELLGKDY